MAPKVSLDTDQLPPFSRTHCGRRGGVSLHWESHADQDSTAYRKIIGILLARLEPWPAYSHASPWDLGLAMSLTG